MGWKCGAGAQLAHRRPLFWERDGSEQMEEGDVKKCNPLALLFVLRRRVGNRDGGLRSTPDIETDDDLRQRKQNASHTLRVGGGGMNNSK